MAKPVLANPHSVLVRAPAPLQILIKFQSENQHFVSESFLGGHLISRHLYLQGKGQSISISDTGSH
ncbi:hypothetical protein I79_010381 [Cricetulus griseus]|uniref:Uncharacterized protein n=1 Tax=Cricetulus griseus TaxID=10029 RepID=G3HIB3_CRIGR|nr:hypothetical protein I79_010381 [Cricetulus griseus]